MAPRLIVDFVSIGEKIWGIILLNSIIQIDLTPQAGLVSMAPWNIPGLQTLPNPALAARAGWCCITSMGLSSHQGVGIVVRCYISWLVHAAL